MEILYGSSTPNPHPEILGQSRDTAIIGFAGAYSGGHNNAQYEQALRKQFGNESVMAIPSASTKYAFQENELSMTSFKNNDYYRDLAEKAVRQFPDKTTYLIHCQSGGGIEGLAFIRALLNREDFQAKTIKVLFTGVPGFSEKSTRTLRRSFELLGRFADMSVNRATYQHFDLCPPPEEYYAYRKTVSGNITQDDASLYDLAYQDTPKTREERRNKFYASYMNILPQEEKMEVARKIARIDTGIKSVLNRHDTHMHQDMKRLMRQRAKIVYSIGGDRYYNEYLAKKPEFKNIPSPGFYGTVVGILYLTRLLSSAAHGVEPQLSDILSRAKKREKTITFSFGLFEHDKIASIKDIPTMKKRLADADIIDAVADWFVIEGLSHESVDNSPQGILSAIMKMQPASG